VTHKGAFPHNPIGKPGLLGQPTPLLVLDAKLAVQGRE
jgi:hypothetical protein